MFHIAIGETIILLTLSLSIPIETLTKDRGGCSEILAVGMFHPKKTLRPSGSFASFPPVLPAATKP